MFLSIGDDITPTDGPSGIETHIVDFRWFFAIGSDIAAREPCKLFGVGAGGIVLGGEIDK